MKNLNLKLNSANLELSEEKKKKIAAALLKNGGLCFVAFFGLVGVYSFNVIYKKAYIDINFIQYQPVTSKISSDNETLEDIISDINDRQDNLKAIEEKKYDDPFSFRDSAKTEEKETPDAGTADTASGSEEEVQIPADSAAARHIR